MTWRTWASPSASSARSAYSTRAVGFWTPPPMRPRYCGPSSFSPSSRRPRASLVAVPSDGMRSPRTSREIVEWSTPDCCASWRCDIFLAFSWARSHSLKARPLERVMARIVGGTRFGPYPPFVQAFWATWRGRPDKGAGGSGALRERGVWSAVVGPVRDPRSGAFYAGAASVTPMPRRFGETAYAIDPRTMIDSTLMVRSTRVMASASFGATP